LTSVQSIDVSGNSGATVEIDGDALVVTIGQQIFALDNVALVISNIINPPYVQTTDDVTIETMNSSGGVLDFGTAGGATLESGNLG